MAWTESWLPAGMIVWILLLANLPFLLFARGRYQLMAMLLDYALFLCSGWALEAQLASPWSQGWAFYAITALFFVVCGFPGWVCRYLRT